MYKFFVGFLVLAGLAAIAAGFYFYSGGGGEGLGIEAVLPDKILIGVPFTIKVGVSNNGNTVLNDMKISLSLPEGLAFVGKAPNKNSETKSLGRAGAGSIIQEEFRLIALAGEQSIKQLVATASYLPEGVSSRFEKKQEIDIPLSESGIALDLIAPERALSGEDFAVDISYKNVADIDFPDLQIKMEYPPAFEYKKASLAPDIGKNIWKLGGLRKGSEMKFSITGNLIGSEDSEHEIKAVLQAEFSGEVYDIAVKSALVKISPSPLSLIVRANNSQDYIASPGDEINYLITYTNNSDQGFRDAVVRVDLKGEMFDLGSVKSNGIIAPGGMGVVWSAVTNPELAVIPPQSSGSLSLSVKVRTSYPIRRLSDKNFILKADARIESLTVPASLQGKSTVGIARLESKVRGNTEIETRVLFRDAESGIVNRGPIPPKVGQPTNYTVHWIIRNYSTDVSGVNVSANLAPGVRATGVTKSNAPGSFSYNESSGMVGWSFEKINATKGVIDKPYEITFQIEATPPPNMAKNLMPLIAETVLTAKDEFTGLDLRDTDEAVNTSIPDDSTIGIQSGTVLP